MHMGKGGMLHVVPATSRGQRGQPVQAATSLTNSHAQTGSLSSRTHSHLHKELQHDLGGFGWSTAYTARRSTAWHPALVSVIPLRFTSQSQSGPQTLFALFRRTLSWMSGRF